MLMIRYTILAFLSVGTMTACGAQENLSGSSGFMCTEEGAFQNESTAYICGSLQDKGTISDFLDSYDPNTKRVVINSGGGFAEVAIKLGRLIRENNWELVVRGYCLSACAHYVLPASTKPITIEDRSIIGFHHTSAAINGIARNVVRRTSDFFKHNEELARGYYKEIGIDQDFLTNPFYLLEKNRMSFDLEKQDAIFAALDYKYENFVSFCFENLEEILKIKIKKYKGCGQKEEIEFDGNRVMIKEYPKSPIPLNEVTNLGKICVSNHSNPSGDLVSIYFQDIRCWDLKN